MAEDKFSNELMSDDELDQVAGGTKSEFKELQKVLPKITDRIWNDVNRCYEDAERPLNRDEVVRYLQDRYLIIADIQTSGSWWNPFSGGANNTYKRNGESLTHAQVVAEIKSLGY